MIDVVVPVEQEGTQAVVRTWLRNVGDRVEENDPLVELETDKVAVEVPAPARGVLREILLESGAEAAPGAILARIAPVIELAALKAETGEPQPSAVLPPAREPERPALDPELRLSPAVKRACIQHNIDPRTIEGTGRDLRGTKRFKGITGTFTLSGTQAPGSHVAVVQLRGERIY